MTYWHSLLACAQADVTMERIMALVATTGTEPLAVNIKEKATPRLAECVAAMANAACGLIFVGITDCDRRIVGVKTETMVYVADACPSQASQRPSKIAPLPLSELGSHVSQLR